jgi:hypothetical protein
MLEYTNSLDAMLETTQKLIPSLTTTEDTLLHKLESQQQELLTQTAKFMTLLSNRTPPHTPHTTSTYQRQPSCNTCNRKPSTGPCYCNSCKKDSVHHVDDDCFTLKKNKDKRPQCYIAKMEDTIGPSNICI